jgi:5-methylcytosine-specific restriction endonuclease McrA
VDHIVPISCGGDDLPDNFAVSCPSCNLSKHDHLLHEWKRCPERIRRLWLEYFSKHAVALNMR